MAARWPALGWVAAAVLIVYPLGRLALEVPASGTAVGAIRGAALAGSLGTSATAAALATLIGAGAALVTERGSGRGRGAARLAMVAPLLIPPFVSAISWQLGYGPGGVMDDLFGLAAPWVEGPIGVTLVITVNAAPLAYLAAAAALASSPGIEAERAARAAGAGPLRALSSVTLPMLRPALAAGGVLAFAFGLNSFGIPIVLGGPAGFDTLTTEVYRGLVRSADPAAFERVVVLAVTLAVLGMVVAVAADRMPSARSLFAAGGRPPPGEGRWRAAAVGVAAILAWSGLTVGVPLLALVARSLTAAPGLDPIPANWSLEAYGAVLDGRLAGAFARSAGLALAAAAAVTVLSALTVWLGRRGAPGPGTVGSFGFAVPGSALAVAVLIAYRVPLGDTMAIILVAYLAKFWALGHRTLAGAASRLGDGPILAARASGATPPAALRTVVVPALAPAVLAGGLLVVLFGIHELTMSSLLRGPGTETLAVVVLDSQQLGDAGVTAALAVVLVGVVGALGAASAAARRLWRRRVAA